MASLAHREDLAGKVQMIYMDPPYGIRYGSNFQSEVGRREVKDKESDLTRELEMVKAYRDTWHTGIHSYLTYVRQRLVVSKELLARSGSIFVQISDENLHLVRTVLDEVFGSENFCSLITFQKTAAVSSPEARTNVIGTLGDYLLWYARDLPHAKYHQLYLNKDVGEGAGKDYRQVLLPNGARRTITDEEQASPRLLPEHSKVFQATSLQSPGFRKALTVPFEFNGGVFTPNANSHWKTTVNGLGRLSKAERIVQSGNTLRYVRCVDDFAVSSLGNIWTDMMGAQGLVFVVQTNERVVERCLLMTTDPGDLVVDPTCGSGTTAAVAEKWGRRWITMDTSRVAVAIARQRLLTARYDFHQMRHVKADELTANPITSWLNDPLGEVQGPCTLKSRSVPHITLKSIAQNQNRDPICEKHEPKLIASLNTCNDALLKVSQETRHRLDFELLEKQRAGGKRSISDADRRRWMLPKKGERFQHWTVPFDTDPDWPKELRLSVTEYRKAWRAKMDEINACIAANAAQEELVDQPEIVKGIVRVSGPFTVEAVQPPERSLGATEGMFDGAPEELEDSFDVKNVESYLDQMTRLLKLDGVRFPNNKEMAFGRLDRLVGQSGGLHAEGRWLPKGETDDDPEGNANVAVGFGPQYGPVTAKQVEDLIRSASRRGYDALVVAGFSFDGPAQAAIEEAQHPKLLIHMASIRPDINPGMAGLLKEQTGSQLFTVFGQPRTRLVGPDRQGDYVVHMEGVDIYDPVANTIRSTEDSKVAAWFVDGDYDGRTFCITQAFFPDKSAWDKLAKALGGVISEDAFEKLSGTISLPFPAGKHKCVAVKVIDPRGNEVMQVHRIG